ncbi:MAG: SUMF1/EgtB/PvdO family nonheme iron enzyme [Candidatus Ozemobacteraceae bacterium]
MNFVASEAINVGTTIGDYTITDSVGEGALTDVFKAKYTFMDRFVAIKVLKKKYCEEKEILDRFFGEAGIGFDMNHSRILKVHGISSPDRRPPYFVMEYLEGKSLREILTCGLLPIEKALTIISGVLEGLIYAHEHPKMVIHRNLKPENIMFKKKDDFSSVVITDFGVAKVHSETRNYTVTPTGFKSSLGTPAYMSPEQCSCGNIDARTDLYSTGIVLFQLLTGNVPFASNEDSVIFECHKNKQIPSPRAINPTIPEWLEKTIRRALEKSPSDRFQSAREFLKALMDRKAAVRDAGTNEVNVPLIPLPGSLFVSSVPAAEIYIDGGMAAPCTPATISGLPSGIHLIEIKKPDFETFSQRIQTKGGENFRLENIVLKPRPFAGTTISLQADRAEVDLGGGVKIKMVLLPPGSFMMGSRKGSESEKPVRLVEITKPFYMGSFQVTQGQYEKVVGKNPSDFRGSDKPVESVSWYDAVEFCNALSLQQKLQPCYVIDKSGKSPHHQNSSDDTKWLVTCDSENSGFRLPTEAEWEYSCRAGTKTEYFWGEKMNEEYCWFRNNSGKTTHEVGTRKPNPWGLHDMSGNVFEWCQDWFGDVYYRKNKCVDPQGENTGNFRVYRGGDWSNGDDSCRSACRYESRPDDRGNYLGFRLVLFAQTP